LKVISKLPAKTFNVLYTTIKNHYKTMKNEKATVLGAAFGVAIGSVIGVLTDNLGLWISLGVAIGAGIGISISQKQKKDKNNQS